MGAKGVRRGYGRQVGHQLGTVGAKGAQRGYGRQVGHQLGTVGARGVQRGYGRQVISLVLWELRVYNGVTDVR